MEEFKIIKYSEFLETGSLNEKKIMSLTDIKKKAMQIIPNKLNTELFNNMVDAIMKEFEKDGWIIEDIHPNTNSKLQPNN